MKSFLEVNGIYNPTLRFAFTNITEEPFTSAWDKAPIVIPAGETVELPHHLAVKLTTEMVDSIMIGQAKVNEVEYYKKNPGTPINMYRAPASLGVPAARKVWEDQILRQLDIDEESPQVQVMRAQIKAELMADLTKETAGPVQGISVNPMEFAELKENAVTPEPVAKKPLKVKAIKKPK
jgi:hypothetical protein